MLLKLNVAALETRVQGHHDFKIEVFQFAPPPKQRGAFGSTLVTGIPLNDAGFEFLGRLISKEYHRIMDLGDLGPKEAIKQYRSSLSYDTEPEPLNLPI